MRVYNRCQTSAFWNIKVHSFLLYDPEMNFLLLGAFFFLYKFSVTDFEFMLTYVCMNKFIVIEIQNHLPFRV